LLVSSFEPLAEMGLVTTIGVALALAAAVWIVPAIVLVLRLRPGVGGELRVADKAAEQ
jgi:predicted RND superfamily exporter protein